MPEFAEVEFFRKRWAQAAAGQRIKSVQLHPAAKIFRGTNPAAINGNTRASELAPAGAAPAQVTRGSVPTLVSPYAADDDGGFFRWRAWAYYQAGAVTLSPLQTPTNLRIVK